MNTQLYQQIQMNILQIKLKTWVQQSLYYCFNFNFYLWIKEVLVFTTYLCEPKELLNVSAKGRYAEYLTPSIWLVHG